MTFKPPTKPFSQDVPLGKIPVIQDGALVGMLSDRIRISDAPAIDPRS